MKRRKLLYEAKKSRGKRIKRRKEFRAICCLCSLMGSTLIMGLFCIERWCLWTYHACCNEQINKQKKYWYSDKNKKQLWFLHRKKWQQNTFHIHSYARKTTNAYKCIHTIHCRHQHFQSREFLCICVLSQYDKCVRVRAHASQRENKNNKYNFLCAFWPMTGPGHICIRNVYDATKLLWGAKGMNAEVKLVSCTL